MPALSRPRSANCFMKVPPWPDGTNTKIASGLASADALQERREVGVGAAARWIASDDLAAAAVRNGSVNDFSASAPGRVVGHDR